MPNSFYKFPFEPSKIIKGEKHPKWKSLDEEEAIKDFIYLILITRQSDYRASSKFGCGVWNSELEIPKKMEVSTWLKSLKDTISASLKSETRLAKVRVDIEFDKIKNAKPDDYKRLDVVIKGYMPNLQRNFEFRRTLIFNPLSFQ